MIVRGFAVAALFVALSVGASAQSPTHRMLIIDHRTIAASIGFDIHTTDFTVTRWIVYLPEPPELPSQTKVKTAFEPLGTTIAEKSLLARKIRVIDVPLAAPTRGAALSLKQQITATLRTRRLVPLKSGEKPPMVPALTSAERKFYLASSLRIDCDTSAFKNWLVVKKLNRDKSEPPLDYAARVLKVIRRDYAYKFDQADEKRASVSCSRAATDCGGMTFIFVAAMRANDIPARVLVGRLAQTRKPGSTPDDCDYDQPHVRAEFHAAGIGWVPVDPAFANFEKSRPVEQFIGEDLGDMLVLHVDLDLRLPTPGNEQVVDMMQLEPYVWTFGFGKLDVALGPTKWHARTKLLAGAARP
jgi:transglutaminase-like putative cysteine protease